MLSGYAATGRSTRRGLRQKAHLARQVLGILAWLPLALWTAQGALGADHDSLAPARDLARDGRELRARRLPLLVLYSQKSCSWCDKARREYLLPMQKDAAYRDRLMLRQIDLDSDVPLTDFTGRRTTHSEFARAERARLTPTIAFYGPEGERLSEPIVGLRIADFYGAYLERGIDESLAKLRPGAR
jgi:thioredoxin-related protein